jgi:hypothetical protein
VLAMVLELVLVLVLDLDLEKVLVLVLELVTRVTRVTEVNRVSSSQNKGFCKESVNSSFASVLSHFRIENKSIKIRVVVKK